MSHLFHLIHAFHPLVDQMLCVEIIMEYLHVLVYQIILEDLQVAVQNVQLMLNVQEILLVLMRNVETHALVLVVYTQIVTQ